MAIDNKRRLFLKNTAVAGATGLAIGVGLMIPHRVLAAWPTAAFQAKQTSDALQALLGQADANPSDKIRIKAPDIAENGAVVPVTVESDLDGIEEIAILASNNPSPLIASFSIPEGTEGFVSTRIKMGKSGDVVAVVKTKGGVFSANKLVKVTIGGCGG